MEVCLRPMVSCRLITIIRQRMKGIEKIKKYSQKNVRIVYNSLLVCVCVDYICMLLCVVI